MGIRPFRDDGPASRGRQNQTLPYTMRQEITPTPEGITLVRYRHLATGTASYLLADRESATAIVVDPHEDVDPYLEDAWRFGSKVKHIFLTQRPEDFRSGHLELRDRACAMVYAGAWTGSGSEFMLVKQGDAFEFGRTRLRVLETPGHRLEALVLLVDERDTKGPNPYAVFSGKTVLIGDVGRPDRRAEDGFDLTDLGSMLYDTLHGQLLPLSGSARLHPTTLVHPDSWGIPLDTLQDQREMNPGFRTLPRDEFIRRCTLGMMETLSGSIGVKPLGLEAFLDAVRAGAQVVDDRSPSEFASAHLAGSINIPAASAFERWAPAVLERDRRILLVTRPGREGATAARLCRLGFRSATDFLDGGMESLGSVPDRIRMARQVSYPALTAKLVGAGQSLFLDTRPSHAPRLGPGSYLYSLPLEELSRAVSTLPKSPEIIVGDDTPYRSSAAASFLRSRGFERVADISGGLALWGQDHARP